MTCTGGAHCIIMELITPLPTHYDTDDLREGKKPFLKSGPLHNENDLQLPLKMIFKESTVPRTFLKIKNKY
jgi:hypothetical protein